MRPPRTVGSVILDVLLVWIMVAVAAAAFWPVYRATPYLVAAGGAVLAGTIVALLGARFRWPSFVVLLVSVAVFLVAGVPLAVPARAIAGVLPSWDGILDLAGAVVFGWLMFPIPL